MNPNKQQVCNFWDLKMTYLIEQKLVLVQLPKCEPRNY